MTRAKKGPQAQTAPESMLAPVFKAVIKKAGIKPEQVDEITIGNCLQGGAGAASTRMAQFLAGIPATTPLYVINRQCSSGLQAVMNVANQIRVGEIDIGIGGGVESMTLFPMQNVVNPETLSEAVFENENARNCMMSMGVTAENVAEQYGITRTMCDQMGVDSHAKAAASQKAGWPAEEITPYETIVRDKDGNEKTVTVDRDDGVRPGTSL